MKHAADSRPQHAADMELEDKKLLTSVTVAEINTKAQNQSERIAALEDLMSQFHQQAHDIAMQKDQQGHDAQQAAAAQQNQQAMAQQQAQQPQEAAPQV